MIRVLVLIAVAGFFVSLVSISTAIGIGGPDVLAHAGWGWARHGGWNWSDEDWGDRDWTRHGRWGRHDGGPQTTKDFTWDGGDSLEVDVPADVQYTQGPTAKVTVTGPARAVEDLEISGGHVRYDHGDHRNRHWDELTIVMTAPAVSRFEISGSGKIAIAAYKQDKLDLRISGNGQITAAGEARDVSVDVSGSGQADLATLAAKTADVEIHGSGEATLAPTDAAKVEISGSGDVTLLTHPPKLESNISGSGRLHTEDRSPSAAAPPPLPPAPPAPPKPKGKVT
ncbi:MAG: GIN domain-containing protein [Phenylobacterium sp.]